MRRRSKPCDWSEGVRASELETQAPATRYLSRPFFRLIAPLERALCALEVGPSTLTVLAVLFSAASCFAISTDHFRCAGLLYLFSGLLDLLDGRVARACGRASRRGALLDSVADRGSELLVFGGLCWAFRGSSILILVLIASAGSLLVSYVRARGEALGVSSAGVGRMQRPERLLLLGVALVGTPCSGPAAGWLLCVGLALLALLSLATAVARVCFVWRALEEPAEMPRRTAAQVPASHEAP